MLRAMKTHRIYHTLLAFCACIALTTSPHSAFGQSTITLTNGEWPPITSNQLDDGGFFSHISKAAFALEGIDVDYRYMPWKRAMETAKHGKYQGSIAWRKTPKWEKDFLYSDPVFSIQTVFFFNKATRINWNDLYDLGHLKFGGTRGFLYLDLLEPVIKRAGGKLEIANADLTNMKKLAERRIDIFPCALSVGHFLMNNHLTASERASIRVGTKSILDGELYVLISREVSNGQDIIDRFNRGLAKLRASGEYNRIIQSWSHQIPHSIWQEDGSQPEEE